MCIRVPYNAVALAASLAACGSSSRPAEVTGTVAGQTIAAREAISMIGNPICSNWSGLNSTILTIFITDAAGSCTAAQRDDVTPDTKSLVLSVARFCYATGALACVPGDMPIEPGHYTIGCANVVPLIRCAAARFGKADASCQQTVSVGDGLATGGTIDITRLSPAVDGTFEVEFANGGKLAGSFSAPPCAGATLVLADLCAGNPAGCGP